MEEHQSGTRQILESYHMVAPGAQREGESGVLPKVSIHSFFHATLIY